MRIYTWTVLRTVLGRHQAFNTRYLLCKELTLCHELFYVGLLLLLLLLISIQNVRMEEIIMCFITQTINTELTIGETIMNLGCHFKTYS
jgi:hypothetical protein